VLGDKWSLIVIRDIMFGNRRHFRELLTQSEEGIASNILASRLQRLVNIGIITKSVDKTHRQKVIYNLTEPGIELLPVLAQIEAWGRRFLPVREELSMSGFTGNPRALPVAGQAEAYPLTFDFLGVKTTRTSAQLTWTPAGSDARYLVFSQEIYGVYFTKKNRFEFVGLQPRKTYNVFVLVEKRGPKWIAFTSFKTLE
jgi:DNA-binding HxlR family transcriptional regulator